MSSPVMDRMRDVLANGEIRTPAERRFVLEDFEAALAEERRATVERIRMAADELRASLDPIGYLDDILDAELER